MMSKLTSIVQSITGSRRSSRNSNAVIMNDENASIEKLNNENVTDNLETIAESPNDQQKNQNTRVRNLKTRPKEPEIIEISSDDEEFVTNDENKKSGKTRSRSPNNSFNSDKESSDNSNKVKNTKIISINGDKKRISFEPWNVLNGDVDRKCFNSLEKILPDSNFIFNLPFDFARFGNLQYKFGNAEFASHKGIAIVAKEHDDEIRVTIGKEDIVYAAGYFFNKVNVIFIHPSEHFVKILQSQLLSKYTEKYMDPNSTNETYRRILIIFSNPIMKNGDFYLKKFFDRIIINTATEITSGRFEFLTKEKTQELVHLSIGSEAKSLITDRMFLQSKAELNRKVAKYPLNSSDSVEITVADVNGLCDTEFLNDNIISFYTRYLKNEILSEHDRNRTHIFDSFFYQRLTLKDLTHKRKEQTEMSQAERRHLRVKNWTRNINLFEKDFIIIPINKSQHWYLAIICYPSLTAPVLEYRKVENNDDLNIKSEKIEELKNDLKNLNEDETTTKKNNKTDDAKTVLDVEDDESVDEAESVSDDLNGQVYLANKDKNMICTKMPCIILFDSLPSSKRNKVVATLIEYLQCEWNAKYPDKERQFTTSSFLGISAKVPIQNNYFDCGIYLLQYVESFFSNPIQDFTPPIDLKDWFKTEIVSSKREEIRNIIANLEKQQQTQNLNKINNEYVEIKSENKYSNGCKKPRLSFDTEQNVNNNKNNTSKILDNQSSINKITQQNIKDDLKKL